MAQFSSSLESVINDSGLYKQLFKAVYWFLFVTPNVTAADTIPMYILMPVAFEGTVKC